MSTLVLRVDVLPGSGIEAVARDLCGLADQTNITTQTSFNGVSLLASPGDSALQLAAAWEEALHSNRPYKIARGRPVKGG